MRLRDNPVRLKAYQGADGRAMELAVVDDDGDAVDLTGYTVQISARLGDTYKISRATCTLDDAAAGEVSYTPQAAQIDTVGEHKAMLRLVDGASLVDYTDEFIIDVYEPIDNAA